MLQLPDSRDAAAATAAAAPRPPRATEAACLACAGKHRPHTCGKKHAVRVKLEDEAHAAESAARP